jgi:hypothetical protein
MDAKFTKDDTRTPRSQLVPSHFALLSDGDLGLDVVLVLEEPSKLF